MVGAEEPEATAELPGHSPIRPEEPPSRGMEQPEPAPQEPLLSEQLGRARTMAEVEALAREEREEEQERPVAPRAEKRVQQQQQEEGRAGDTRTKPPPAKKKKKMISLQAVLEEKPQQVPWPSLPVVVEEEVRGQRDGPARGAGGGSLRGADLCPPRRVASTREG